MMKRSLSHAFPLVAALALSQGLAGCAGVPDEEAQAVVEEASAAVRLEETPASVRPMTVAPKPLTDADFEQPTCGIQDFTAAQLKTALAGQPTQEFDGVTVRHRSRRCVAPTEYGAGTCSAWEPTVTGTNRRFSITIYRYPGGGWVKPYRYVKMVGGSSLDPATFRVRYSDPDLTPFVVESTSMIRDDAIPLNTESGTSNIALTFLIAAVIAVSAGVVQLQPITISIASIFIFNEHLTWQQWCTGALAVGGAAVMLTTQHRAAKRAKQAPIDELDDLPVDWSIIGHLQTNKVKYLTRFAREFHALDSLRLADLLNKRLEREDRFLDVYVQVNTSSEESKYGLSPDALLPFVDALDQFPRLKPRGLMTLALLSADMDKVRPCFALLRRLRDEAVKRNAALAELSMGMSGDFEEAIEEGADVVRVGQAIFGKRPTPDGHYWPGLIST